ncbi:uncharacterized protein LOC122939347 [Bufo gargarizans]|uniref:uncharacterized protein LOC122939347 n=1 Tax=Bufo gargarizans TaxID=30331 RepID=UPI001CF318F3|nr:uncharacterized protein LOC122939347 [Bufo gargarizans]
MKRNRPSGSQQRKIKKAREKSAEAMSGSILKYVAPSTSTAVGESAEDIQSGDVAPSTSTAVGESAEDIQSGDVAPSTSTAVGESAEDIQSGESRGEMPEVSSQENFYVNAQELEKIVLASSGESDVDEGDASKSLHRQESDDDEEEKEEETVRLSVYSDVAAWPVPVPDVLRVDLIKRGSEPFQNRDGPFNPVERQGEKSKGKSRQLTTAWFYKALPNGEKVLRTWMVYSPSKQSLFCFCCRLFAVDDKLTVDREKRKWRDILHRLLDVTLFLAHQNLPFRGHRETMSSANKGNFLELIDLLSNYDPILKEHSMRLKHAVASGKRMCSYFSPKILNELICLLGNHVKDKIVADIKKEKYFGILFDSTPDVSHTDQMCEVIRYVHIEGDKVEVKESFLSFFPIAGKTAAELTENILQHLEEDGLDISLCHGQGYDNAATMAGIHGGVQAKIKEINPKAFFMPCANHSLNLCGVHSFGSVVSCVTFFGTLERVYVSADANALPEVTEHTRSASGWQEQKEGVK